MKTFQDCITEVQRRVKEEWIRESEAPVELERLIQAVKANGGIRDANMPASAQLTAFSERGRGQPKGRAYYDRLRLLVRAENAARKNPPGKSLQERLANSY
jgi:hypothetical protein